MELQPESPNPAELDSVELKTMVENLKNYDSNSKSDEFAPDIENSRLSLLEENLDKKDNSSPPPTKEKPKKGQKEKTKHLSEIEKEQKHENKNQIVYDDQSILSPGLQRIKQAITKGPSILMKSFFVPPPEEVREKEKEYEDKHKWVQELMDLDIDSRKKALEQLYPHRYIHRHEPLLEDYLGKSCMQTRYVVKSNLYLMNSFFSLADFSSIFILVMSVGATLFCIHFDIASDLGNISLLATGILFPISFTIGYLHNRRERVLLDFADLKASMVALYQLHREWGRSFPKTNYAEECKGLMGIMVKDIIQFMGHKAGKERVYRIYKSFDELSKLNESLRNEADWVKSVLARAYQYQRYIILDWERIRTVHDYRTVSTLRAFAQIFLMCYPILFAPFFAYAAKTSGYWVGIYVSLLSTFIFVSLYKIQEELEDPFDGLGVDDINLDMLSEMKQHMFEDKEK